MEEGATQLDNIASEFATYEDFLNSQISPVDLYYLEVLLPRPTPAAPPSSVVVFSW